MKHIKTYQDLYDWLDNIHPDHVFNKGPLSDEIKGFVAYEMAAGMLEDNDLSATELAVMLVSGIPAIDRKEVTNWIESMTDDEYGTGTERIIDLACEYFGIPKPEKPTTYRQFMRVGDLTFTESKDKDVLVTELISEGIHLYFEVSPVKHLHGEGDKSFFKPIAAVSIDFTTDEYTVHFPDTTFVRDKGSSFLYSKVND